MQQPPPPAAAPTPVPVAPSAPPGVPPAPRRPPGRRGRRLLKTAALWAAALLLGTSGGVAAGYQVQADRPPTPFPPLAQPGLAYPDEPAEATAALTAEEDLRVPYEGDLRELLVEAPEDSSEERYTHAEDGWLDLHDYALTFTDSDYMFSFLLDSGIRRVAEVGWEQYEWRTTRVQLIQFREERDLQAPTFATDQQETMLSESLAGSKGKKLPDGMNGRYYLWDETFEEPGYYPYTRYAARVIAQRGDIVMDIGIHDYDNAITEKTVLKLAAEQWERL